MSCWPWGWLRHGARGSGQAGLQTTSFPQPIQAWHESTTEPECLFVIIIHYYYSSGGSPPEVARVRVHLARCLCPSFSPPSAGHPQTLHPPPFWPCRRLSGRALVSLSLHIHHSARFCLSYAQLSSLFIAFLAASIYPSRSPPVCLPRCWLRAEGDV